MTIENCNINNIKNNKNHYDMKINDLKFLIN